MNTAAPGSHCRMRILRATTRAVPVIVEWLAPHVIDKESPPTSCTGTLGIHMAIDT